MIIGGLQKFSLLDYPEHIAAIIFTQGCNFRCQFCYNPMLVWPNATGQPASNKNKPGAAGDQYQKGHPTISEDDLFDFLKSRRGRLDAVVITGGEPTIHSDLPEFITAVKKQGFKIKLDTNGTHPETLRLLIGKRLIDYIAMDIKGPAEKYDLITGIQPDLNKIKESVKIIMDSGLPYEFRTTLVPELILPAEVRRVGNLIRGAAKWYLQAFKTDTELINPSFQNVGTYTGKQMEKMREIGSEYVEHCAIR